MNWHRRFTRDGSRFLDGRPLAGSAQNATVNLTTPGQLYGDRVNHVDFRFAKIPRFGGTRTNIGLDLYNLFNVNTATGYNEDFGFDGAIFVVRCRASWP